MIGKKLAHYEVLSRIGAGGMGEVYRARDTKLGREIALKVLPAELAADEDRRRRFLHEARAVAALNHPNIVTLYAVEQEKQRGASYLDTISLFALPKGHMVNGWAKNRSTERMDRGSVSMPAEGGTRLSWRLLANDGDDAAFDV